MLMTADDLGGGGGDSANSVASKVDDLEIDDLTLAEAKESARGGRHRVDPRPASAHRRKEGRKIMVPPSTAPPGHDDITTAAAKAAPFDKNDDQKRDDSGNYGMSGALPESTQSRARALARQREIQMRKRQQSMQSAAMMRGASGMLPNGQFTPGVAQFSAPRAVDDDPYGPFGDRGDAWRPALASASMAGPHAARDPENYGATHLADARATTQRLRQPAESRPQTASSVYSDDPQRYDRQLTSRSPPTRDTPDADYRSPQSLRSSGHSPYRAHPEERWSSSDYRRESDARQQQPPPQRGPDDEYYRRQRSDRDGAESWRRDDDVEQSGRRRRREDDPDPPRRRDDNADRRADARRDYDDDRRRRGGRAYRSGNDDNDDDDGYRDDRRRDDRYRDDRRRDDDEYRDDRRRDRRHDDDEYRDDRRRDDEYRDDRRRDDIRRDGYDERRPRRDGRRGDDDEFHDGDRRASRDDDDEYHDDDRRARRDDDEHHDDDRRARRDDDDYDEYPRETYRSYSSRGDDPDRRDWQRRSDEEPSREPTRSNRDDDDYEPPPRPEEREAADGAAAAKSKAEPPPPEFDITALPLHNMRKFLTEPCPRAAGIVQCYIKRNRSGTNKLFPEYTVYMKEGDRFLMCSKKRPNNKTSNYLISMGENDLKRNSPNYIGKLRANFAGTEFQIFDAGWNPKSFEPDLEDEGAQMRNELGAVIYTSNVLGSRGPRKMQVAIPKIEDVVVKDDAKPSQQPARGVTDILTKMKAHDYASLIYMINKPPRWNEQVGAYVLNFNGRVTMASVKNFQLVQPEEQESIFLQFGRVGKDEFTMDFQWPMTPFAAFAITLSSFDSKIACE